MNPATRALLNQLDDPAFANFIEGWDQLEGLLVHIHRANTATAEEEAEFKGLRQRLKGHYLLWKDDLSEFWPRTRVSKQHTRRDPFQRILETEDAGRFVVDWALMQTLPAAREAINLYLVSRLEEQKTP
jgi:hypothetical protein